jgi:hypothetical protein
MTSISLPATGQGKSLLFPLRLTVPLKASSGKELHLSYIQAPGGACLTAGDLKKLPANHIKNLLSSASAFFSRVDLKKFLASFKGSNGNFQPNASISAMREWKLYQGNIVKIDQYAQRAQIGPYKFRPQYQYGSALVPELKGSYGISPYKIAEISRKTLCIPEAEASATQTAQLPVGVGATAVYISSKALQYSVQVDGAIFQSMCQGSIPLYGLSSGFIIYNAYNDLKKAAAIRDKEGEKEAARCAFEGGVLATGTFSWAAADILTHSSHAAAAIAGAAALSTTSAACFGLGYALGATVASYNILRCMRFRNSIDALLENRDLSEEQRVRGALLFLRDKIFIAERDLVKIEAEEKARNPNATPEEFKKNMELAVSLFAQKKIAKFKRRSGEKSAAETLCKLDKILKKINSPIVSEKGIEEGKALLDLVKKENYKKIILNCVLMIASLIGLAATIAGTFFSFGALPLFLAIVTGIISFFMTYFSYYYYMSECDNKL